MGANYERTERRKSVLTQQDKEDLIKGVTDSLLQRAPEELWGALYAQAGKGSFKVAFALMRYAAVAWLASYWDTIMRVLRPKG